MASILVVGYYSRGNLGDETYKLVFPLLFPPNVPVTFANIDDDTIQYDKYTCLVVGGGDLINDYYTLRMEKILQSFSGLRIAISIGVSYPVYLEHRCLSLFDHVFIRNKTDIRRLQKYLGSRAHYLPDAAFLLENPIQSSTQALRRVLGRTARKPRIGIFLASSAFYRSTEKKGDETLLMYSLLNILEKLGSSSQYDFVLYRYNTGGSSDEDDSVINSWLMKRFTGLARHSFTLDNTEYSPVQMLQQISGLDIAICMRFHAHVYAALAGVPILSLNISRKAKLLMNEMKLHEYICTPKTDKIGATLSFDLQEVFGKLQGLLSARSSVVSRLLEISETNRFLLQQAPIRVLLSNNRIPSRIDVKRDSTALEIVQEVSARMNQIITPEIATSLAELISLRLTGQKQSEYNYGTINHLMTWTSSSHIGTKEDRTKEDRTKLLSMVEWILEDRAKKSIPSDRPFEMDYFHQDDYKGLHRAGWHFVSSYLRCLSSPNGVILDTFLDRTFHWEEARLLAQGLLPYTAPWVGFLHHTPLMSYSCHNSVDLFAKESFRASLVMCKGIYVFTEGLADWVREALQILGYPAIIVEVLSHPTAFVRKSLQFSMANYRANRNPKLINIGAWYRDPFAIYRLNLPRSTPSSNESPLRHPLRKCALWGPKMDNYFIPSVFHLDLTDPSQSSYTLPDEGSQVGCRDLVRQSETICRPPSSGLLSNKWIQGLITYYHEHRYPVAIVDYDHFADPSVSVYDISSQGSRDNLLSLDLESKINSVTILSHKSDTEYDELLSSNIVFLKLVDAAAVNTIIECIVRATPVVVNRLSALEEVLGKGYPLFYNALEEASALLTDDYIEAAHEYLKHLETDQYRVENFITSIRESQIYRSITL